MSKRPNRYGINIETPTNTLLIDGNALFKFGFFGAKNEYNHNGQHIGGLYSFLNIFRKILTTDLYHKAFVFWDGNLSGKLRYDIYEDYKKNKNKNYINGTKPIDEVELLQRKMVWDYLNELYVRQIMDEIVETDDFIAYYCLNREPNEKITIVSTDRDFLQLIDENIRIYFLDLKTYVDNNNFSLYFCFNRENAMLIKMMIGDTSDCIKGIKGLKETTLLSFFPELKEKKLNLDEVIELAKKQQTKRIEEKKKPLKVLNNIINKITNGKQKERIYEINEKLVNLKKPMLTESSINALNFLKEGTFDISEQDLKNVLRMMRKDGLDKAMGEYRYNDFLIPFKQLMLREQKHF